MRFTPTLIPGAWIIEPVVREDPRGFFMETYRRSLFAEHGIRDEFVQINHSQSVRHTLRGLHYQVGRPQAKLVRAVRGAVFDVVVDIRAGSPAYGRWFSVELSAKNRKQVFAPAGCAHGFCVLSGEAEFLYFCSDYYHPEGERGVIWNDPGLAIPWPTQTPLLSDKDRRHPPLAGIAGDVAYRAE